MEEINSWEMSIDSNKGKRRGGTGIGVRVRIWIRGKRSGLGWIGILIEYALNS